MAVIVFFAYKGILAVLGSNGTATLLSIGIGAVVYGLMILRTKTIERDELMSMPMGRVYRDMRQTETVVIKRQK